MDDETERIPFPSGQAPGRDPTRPDPGSDRTLRGGTPTFDVRIRLRARDDETARNRINRWVATLADYASVDHVELVERDVLVTDPTRALRAHGYPITKEEQMGGVRILDGTYDGTRDGAVLVDGSNDTAFGPIFDSYDDAERFVQWIYGYGVVRAIENAESSEGPPLKIVGVVERPSDPRSYSPADLASAASFWTEHVRQVTA